MANKRNIIKGDTVAVVRGTKAHRSGKIGEVRNILRDSQAYVYFGVGKYGIIRFDRLEVVKSGENRGET